MTFCVDTLGVKRMGQGMRKTASILAILLLSSMAAFSQSPADQSGSVTLLNMEDSWLYFVMDPKDLEGLTAASPLLNSSVSSYFSTESEDFPFTRLTPGGSFDLAGLADGSHLLVGFFARQDRTEFPVRVLTVQVDKKMGTRFYSIFAEPALFTITRDTGRLAKFEGAPGEPAVAAKAPETAAAAEDKEPKTAEEAPAVAETPAATVQEPIELATYSPSFAPAVFTKESAGDFSVKPIAQAVYWDKNGTRVKAISGLRTDGAISIDIASDKGFSKEVSYFFYLFGERTLGKENSLTLEIKPVLEGAEDGIVLLWEKGKQIPTAIGTVKVEGEMCRFSADLGSLPAEAASSLGENASADFTACYFDEGSGVYEEFFYTTLALREFPVSTR